MNKYKITYIDDEEKQLEADGHQNQKDFIEFYAKDVGVVFTVRSKDVKSIEMIR